MFSDTQRYARVNDGIQYRNIYTDMNADVSFETVNTVRRVFRTRPAVINAPAGGKKKQKGVLRTDYVA